MEASRNPFFSAVLTGARSEIEDSFTRILAGLRKINPNITQHEAAELLGAGFGVALFELAQSPSAYGIIANKAEKALEARTQGIMP